MANKLVLGIIDCPYCGKPNIVGWDGNHKTLCLCCNKKITVKRTRMRNTKTISSDETTISKEEL